MNGPGLILVCSPIAKLKPCCHFGQLERKSVPQGLLKSVLLVWLTLLTVARCGHKCCSPFPKPAQRGFNKKGRPGP